jgi:hypothetical protein
MFGYANQKEVPAKWSCKVTKRLYDKYSKRYHIDKVLQELELSWGVLLYGKDMRGIYAGFASKITLQQLVTVAEGKKKRFVSEQLKLKKEQARKIALAELLPKPHLKVA